MKSSGGGGNEKKKTSNAWRGRWRWPRNRSSPRNGELLACAQLVSRSLRPRSLPEFRATPLQHRLAAPISHGGRRQTPRLAVVSSYSFSSRAKERDPQPRPRAGTLSQRFEPAPRARMAEEMSSAGRPMEFRCSATRAFTRAMLAFASTKISAEGPAPLNTTPRMPEVPFNFCNAGNRGQSVAR